MLEFTEQERMKIDDLIKRDFENATPDEVRLYAKWEAEKALRDEEFKARLQARADESKAKIAELKRNANSARDGLKALKAAAIARLEQIDNGQ